jgi:phosphoribosylformylglycinamidine synthase
MKIRVDVTLREGVLDPQGKAIGHALASLGFSGVTGVRVGKCFEIELQETNEAKAKETAKAMAEKLLANLVIEDYSISVE